MWNRCQTCSKTKVTYKNSEIGEKVTRFDVWENYFLLSFSCQSHFQVSTKWESFFFRFLYASEQLFKWVFGSLFAFVRFAFSPSAFFFLFFFSMFIISTIHARYYAMRETKLLHCSWNPQPLYSEKKNIKNRSHRTIHTFKNYFATVFSVFSKISCIQTDSKITWTRKF